jgi:hypothetical protein
MFSYLLHFLLNFTIDIYETMNKNEYKTAI